MSTIGFFLLCALFLSVTTFWFLGISPHQVWAAVS
jgi:hypothetical protein